MKENEFIERVSSLRYRLESALSVRCHLVAKAKIRDIARLTEEYDGTPYDETCRKLMKECGLYK